MTSTDTDAELDQSILSADKAREQYVLQRLRTRRKMAMIAFAQFVFGGALLVIGGLLLPNWADRIDHMGTFLSLYFSALAAVIMAYWGIGSYERNSYGNYGGGYGGSVGYGGTDYMAPPHPTLTKTPRAAG